MLFFLRFRPFKASREKSESHGNKLPASTIESPIPDVRLIYVEEGVIPLVSSRILAPNDGLTHWNEWDIENPTWNVFKTYQNLMVLFP